MCFFVVDLFTFAGTVTFVNGVTSLVCRIVSAAVVIVSERDKIGTLFEIDSVRFVIEMGKLDEDVTVVVIGIVVVPVEVVVVVVVRAAAIDDVVAAVVVIVVVAVTICDSLVSIFCFGSVVNIDVADDADDDDDDNDSCAVAVVVAMDDVSDGCFASSVG